MTTAIFNDIYVRIDWEAPYDGESPIQSYTILIQDSQDNYIEEPISCIGSDPSVTFCDVPIATLRATPFNLQQGDSVYAIVRAINVIGLGLYSEPNSVGVVIEDIPDQMAKPTRGVLTTESQLEIKWVELVGAATGGDPIDSYNVKWDQGTDTWADLVG